MHKRQRKRLLRMVFYLVGLPVLIMFLMIGNLFLIFGHRSISQQTELQNIIIRPGTSFRQIAQELKHKEIIAHPYQLEWLARLSQRSRHIKTGVYTTTKGMTYQELLNLMTEPVFGSFWSRWKYRNFSVIFIEGQTFKQIRDTLNKANNLKHLTQNKSDMEILQLLNSPYQYPEGLFFPDTYFYEPEGSDWDILKRAYHRMESKLSLAWMERDASTPCKTPYEALIMASIVEKETGRAEERHMIAGVFVNRLHKKMRLQTDPAVIYGIKNFDGDIKRHHLREDTPYNTYTRDGLPPTPIAMPGFASILAALHPAKTEALYFVGKGDGTHIFSNTLVEHNQAVQAYQIDPHLEAINAR